MKRVRSVLAVALVLAATMTEEAKAGLYCKTIVGEVEGFGRNYTRDTAERGRDRAVEEEKARRREMGREIVRIEPLETECRAVYPLGFEEWYCIAKTDVCVET